MNNRSIAYFSMEIALESGMPTYAGGLGVLAGDTIHSAADMKMPLVAISLVHRKGYFYQRLDSSGRQIEEVAHWNLDDYLQEMPDRTSVIVEGREVQVRAWKHEVIGNGGYRIPVYLLDTDLPENGDFDRTLTHWLYGGDQHYRLCQEVVLGIGGVRMLRTLGHDNIRQFHMNEGHASLLTLELLDQHARQANRTQIADEDIQAVHNQCIFTTHTPVPAGHDQFPMDLVNRVLGRREIYERDDVFCCEGLLNMTYLALNLSHYVNGVAKGHGLVSQHMFSNYVIDAITNGVHVSTWTSPAFQTLFDRYIPGWREDNYSLRYALSIPANDVWFAHQEQKRQLIRYVNHAMNAGFDADVLTIGYARRMTAYKRPDLLFQNLDRLRRIAEGKGRLQIVFSGKAHPRDNAGKELISQVFQAANSLKDHINVTYLPNYDIEIGKLITAGVDVWLNTPEPPMEASGTSGMKAALNGVPSLSILDGWWIEGCLEGLTGWSIGEPAHEPQNRIDGPRDAASLYQKLEETVVPIFYENRARFVEIMQHAIALNGSFFNTQRMLGQYVVRAYFS